MINRINLILKMVNNINSLHHSKANYYNNNKNKKSRLHSFCRCFQGEEGTSWFTSQNDRHTPFLVLPYNKAVV